MRVNGIKIFNIRINHSCLIRQSLLNFNLKLINPNIVRLLLFMFNKNTIIVKTE